MRAGKLDHWVTFQEKGSGRLPNGQPNNAFTDVFSDWAQVLAIRANQRLESAHDQSTVNYKLIMYYRTDVHGGMRVSTDFGWLDVVDAYPLHGLKEFIEIPCKSWHGEQPPAA